MALKFKSPPISELVIGVYFDRDIPSLQPELVGVFWNRHRLQFPRITQQPPLSRPFSYFSIGGSTFGEITSMPRYWLESIDEATLIQIQANAFLVNWRKRNDEYPHFENVKSIFDTLLGTFNEFIKEYLDQPPPRIQLAELTYVNSIEPCAYWSSLADTPKILPRFTLPVPTKNELAPAEFQQMTVDKIATDMTLVTNIRSGRVANDLTKPALVFELRAIGLIPDNEWEADWFRRAHELTGKRFTEMTSADIQTIYWQPE
jgi:uncharacterized protein (TIGR04255 family)